MCTISTISSSKTTLSSIRPLLEEMGIHLQNPIIVGHWNPSNNDCLWIEQVGEEGSLWFSWLEGKTAKQIPITDLELFEDIKRLMASGNTLSQILEFLVAKKS